MKNNKNLKYGIIGGAFILIIALVFIINGVVTNNKVKSDSEWIINSYNYWEDKNAYLYLKEEAAYEFFNYLIEEEKVDETYMNYIVQEDRAVYFISNDGKNYVAYEVLFEKNKLEGGINYLGSNKNLFKLLDKCEVNLEEDELYYEIDQNGISKTSTYEVVFKDHFGNIIPQIDEFGYKTKALVINDGKTVSQDYNYYNYNINNGNTIGYVFKGWKADGIIQQSPFTITKDMIFTAEVEMKPGLVNNGKNVFATLEEAIENSKPGDKLVLMKDITVDKLTIPEGITLVIPASNYNTNVQIDGDTSSSKTPVDDKPFVTLTVNDLTVNGQLLISSVIGYPGSGGACQGHTSGDHGLLIVNNSLTVNGLVDASGYIKGNGKANVYGTINCPFLVRDFRGGTNTLGVYSNGNISPFNVYELINVQIDTTYHYGATLAAYGNLYASSQFNKAKSPVIGEGGVIVLNEGSTALVKYDNNTKRGSITLNGGAKDGNFSLTVMGFTVTIEGVFFPLPHSFDIILENGTYELNSSYKLLPGSKFIVGENAVCNLNNEVIVYSEFNDTEYNGSKYPVFEPTNDRFIVKGKLNIKHSFGGLIKLEENGIINVDSNSVLELTSKEGYANGTDITGLFITSTIHEKAQYVKDGVFNDLATGNTYK